MERVKEYNEIPSEAPFKRDQDPPKNWLDKGSIQFDRFSIRYRLELNFQITYLK